MVPPSVEPPSTAAVAFGASRGGDASFGAGVASRDELVDDDVELTAVRLRLGTDRPRWALAFAALYWLPPPRSSDPLVPRMP
jgi:hypothetical protein